MKKYFGLVIFIVLTFGALYSLFYEEKVNIFNIYKLSEEASEELTKFSKSQIQQDIFVYLNSDKKRNGFFVEFGATDGINLSNSYMLEQQFGWSGILVEPVTIWHEKLKNNRPNSIIETLCVWKESGHKLIFNETSKAPLSTIDKFSNLDKYANARKEGKRYEVLTISLLDLLKKYDAPEYIDYLSIDTEGSEFDILEAYFKNNKHYKIKIITCEHNFTENREKIYNLLRNNGYVRKDESISKHDDFYILQADTPK